MNPAFDPPAVCAVLALFCSAGGDASIAADRFGPREAEHLQNRAAFGARPDEIEAAVARGRSATIAILCEPRPPRELTALAAPDFPGPIVRPEALLERVEQ